MKHLLLLIIVSLFCSLSFAQQSKADKERMSQIRAAYAEAVENARRTCMSDEETDYVPKNYIKTTILHNVAGTGPSTETIEFFFEDDFNEDSGWYDSHLQFVRRTKIYTIAELKEYEEFLYDSDGKPMFYFTSFPDEIDDKDMLIEIRSYYEEGMIFNIIFKSGENSSSMKQRDVPDGYMDLPTLGTNGFTRYKNIFDGLLNYNEN